MKTQKIVILLLTGIGLVALCVVGFRSPEPTTAPSKADQRLLRAVRAIERMPGRSEGYNQLAAAYMQLARETFDFDLNSKADEAIKRSLEVEPDNYDASGVDACHTGVRNTQIHLHL